MPWIKEKIILYGILLLGENLVSDVKNLTSTNIIFFTLITRYTQNHLKILWCGLNFYNIDEIDLKKKSTIWAYEYRMLTRAAAPKNPMFIGSISIWYPLFVFIFIGVQK